MPLRNFLEAEQESKTLFEPTKSYNLRNPGSEFVLLRVGRKF
ncbi:MAG: hypothetical protein JWO06_1693 [Bacteroidota bacterium]|nr:hypothetical protein [Bacteroidota bacterium]